MTDAFGVVHGYEEVYKGRGDFFSRAGKAIFGGGRKTAAAPAAPKPAGYTGNFSQVAHQAGQVANPTLKAGGFAGVARAHGQVASSAPAGAKVGKPITSYVPQAPSASTPAVQMNKGNAGPTPKGGGKNGKNGGGKKKEEGWGDWVKRNSWQRNAAIGGAAVGTGAVGYGAYKLGSD